MKGVYRSVMLVLLGLLFLFMSGGAMVLMVRILGLLFLLPALFSLVKIFVFRGERTGMAVVPEIMVDTGSVIFGLWLLVLPYGFVNVFGKIFALLILILSLYHLYKLFLLRKQGAIALSLFAAPFVLLLVSLSVLFEVFNEGTTALILGLGALASGVVDIVVIILLRRLSNRDSSTFKELEDNAS